MVTKEQIQRINELYKKQTEGGLTEEEKKEQYELRRLYVESVKENLRSQLEKIKIVDEKENKMMNNDGKCSCHNHKH
ncbi:Uncharacterized protein YnzC, UPF0291/DUF896 family [Caloramator quimbayensis]|uniref:UPF0291 protein SAMN05443428_105166 n=1 Tax=Caloramator quimbayensis TaxID=1147123 RepID=A0A1T4X403_9CLOT|nr:DUF896 domain-containing protein [Caloramator quimbayensis]SKA83775.1 Uncharacterized protein YnzC, UPF0291/DUF896 family [Caloramator quimbayensis]